MRDSETKVQEDSKDYHLRKREEPVQSGKCTEAKEPLQAVANNSLDAVNWITDLRSENEVVCESRHFHLELLKPAKPVALVRMELSPGSVTKGQNDSCAETI